MESSIVQYLVQGGAVGIAFVLIWLIYKIIQLCSKNADRVTEVVERNAIAITLLIDSVKENTRITKEMSGMISRFNGLKKKRTR